MGLIALAHRPKRSVSNQLSLGTRPVGSICTARVCIVSRARSVSPPPSKPVRQARRVADFGISRLVATTGFLFASANATNKLCPMCKARHWTAAEDSLLGTMPDSELAKKLGCGESAVFRRRRLLKISPRSPGPAKVANWGTTELAMLGRYTDEEVARITGRTLAEVQAKRRELRD